MVMIDIIYAGNDLMFDGLLLSLLSMLRRTKEGIFVHFLTMDFTHKNEKFKPFRIDQADFLRKELRKFNSNFDFEIIDCTKEYNELLANNANEKPVYSPYCTLRLLADRYDVFKGKVIYLDIDTMVYGDIKELYDIDMTDLEFRASHDFLGRTWIKKDYFNSGIMLLNMDKIRETKLLEKARHLVKTKKMYFTDQTALYLSKVNFEFFPDEYRFNEQRSVKENTVVKHFCKGIRWFPFKVYNVKQWEIEKVQNYLKIREFDTDFEIYKEIKNRYKN